MCKIMNVFRLDLTYFQVLYSIHTIVPAEKSAIIYFMKVRNVTVVLRSVRTQRNRARKWWRHTCRLRSTTGYQLFK